MGRALTVASLAVPALAGLSSSLSLLRREPRWKAPQLLCQARDPLCDPSPEVFDYSTFFLPALPVEYWPQVIIPVRQRIRAATAVGPAPVVLHVGTSELDAGDDEVYLYKHIFYRVGEAPYRVVWVEPEPKAAAALRAAAQQIGLVPERVSVVTAALCPNRSGPTVMYGVSERLYEDFPSANRGYLDDHRSLGKADVLEEFVRLSSAPMEFLKKHKLPMLPLEKWKSYVEESPSHCVTPGSLLLEEAVVPEAIELCIVDAEGVDVQLVDIFLSMPGFAPAVLMFEWAWHDADAEELARLVRTLSARGYDVVKHRHDIIAVLHDSARYWVF